MTLTLSADHDPAVTLSADHDLRVMIGPFFDGNIMIIAILKAAEGSSTVDG